MSTCNMLDLETLRSRPIMPKNLPWALVLPTGGARAGDCSQFLARPCHLPARIVIKLHVQVGAAGKKKPLPTVEIS
jgi:hypothetical protein